MLGILAPWPRMALHENTLAIGFIGCGRAAASLHLPALSSLPGLRAVAACDSDPAALGSARGQFGIPKAYADYRDLIADPLVEAVAVCTPAPYHAEAAVAALLAGKPTFIEKPLALSVADCDRILEAARNGTPAVVGHNLRCHSLVEQARDAIAAGELGKVQIVRSVWTAGFNLGGEMPAWRLRRELGGGALTELGVHHIDLWRFLTGREVTAGQAFSFSEAHDDQAVALQGVLDDGTVCSTALCQRSADSNEVEVFGDKGRLRFSAYQADSLVKFTTADLGGGIGLRIKQFRQQAAQFPALLRSSRRGGAYRESYLRQWLRFVATARGEQPPSCSLEDARAAIQTLCSVQDGLTGARQ
jgi:myo-inositol 2-dehydrogenase / D-chiro-inositol 1-dehydrogenase